MKLIPEHGKYLRPAGRENCSLFEQAFFEYLYIYRSRELYEQEQAVFEYLYI